MFTSPPPPPPPRRSHTWLCSCAPSEAAARFAQLCSLCSEPLPPTPHTPHPTHHTPNPTPHTAIQSKFVCRASHRLAPVPRISVIFRVRSAKAVKITDVELMQRVGAVAGLFSVLLAVRTLVDPPPVIVGRTADDLKAYLCRTDWWDHCFTVRE